MEKPRKMGPPKEMRRPRREVVGKCIITCKTSGYGNRKNGESQPEIRRTKCLVAVVSVHFCSWEKRGSETGMIIQRFF